MNALVAEYGVTRQQINNGDAMLQRGTWHFSKIIQHVTGQTWSHIGCFWWAGDRLMIIEAMEGVGVRLSLASKSLPYFWVPANLVWSREVEDFALDRLGDEYSLIDCARAAAGLPTFDKGWECAELYQAIATKGGLTLDCPAVPGQVAEKMFERGYPMQLVQKLGPV